MKDQKQNNWVRDTSYTLGVRCHTVQTEIVKDNI